MRPFIYKTDLAEFPNGYLEWKPNYLQKYKDRESDQQAIARSRVEVSEELEFEIEKRVLKSGLWDIMEGKDFTIRDGKAYPVENHKCLRCGLDLNEHSGEPNYLCSTKEAELSRLRAENERLTRKLDKAKVIINNAAQMSENSVFKNAIILSLQALETLK